MRNLGAVGETCETLCETSYGETLRFKHEPCARVRKRGRCVAPFQAGRGRLRLTNHDIWGAAACWRCRGAPRCSAPRRWTRSSPPSKGAPLCGNLGLVPRSLHCVSETASDHYMQAAELMHWCSRV